MDSETVVYGCIKDCVSSREAPQRLGTNRRVLEDLPPGDTWPLISREMFGCPERSLLVNGPHTEVVHFGAAYQGIEYEWDMWLREFECVLARMYWVSATVHLETELAGTHSFHWESTGDGHRPGGDALRLRSEWTHES